MECCTVSGAESGLFHCAFSAPPAAQRPLSDPLRCALAFPALRNGPLRTCPCSIAQWFTPRSDHRDVRHRNSGASADIIALTAMNSDIAQIDPNLQQLKRDWQQLSDLDRARRVVEIHNQSRLSFRKIAEVLGRTESLLRHLRRGLLAPAADIAAAQQGNISTNELIRRAEAHLRRQTAMREKSAQEKREDQAAQGARLICDWLRSTQLHGPSCEMILNEVRRELATREAEGTLPAAPQRSDVPVAEIIKRSKPPELVNDSIDLVGWYAHWLFRWTFFAFTDRDLRWTALDLALDQQR